MTRNDASRVDPVPAVDQRPQGAPSRSTPATPLTNPAVPQPTPAALAALEQKSVETIRELREAAQEYSDSAQACDTPALRPFRRRRNLRSIALSEAVDLIESLLAAARRGAGDTVRLDTFGLPPDESPARDTVVELLTAELVAVGALAEEAGETTTFDLRDEEAIRGIVRYMTTRDSGGRDGEFGERKRVFWEKLGRALAAHPEEPQHG